jgi:hypothetical protein
LEVEPVPDLSLPRRAHHRRRAQRVLVWSGITLCVFAVVLVLIPVIVR